MEKINRQIINTTCTNNNVPQQVYRDENNNFFIKQNNGDVKWVKIERRSQTRRYFKTENVFGYVGEVFKRLDIYTPWVAAFDCIIIVTK